VKRRLVLLLLVVAGSSATVATAPAATQVRDARATQPLGAVHTCSSSRYRHAIIEGKHKCRGSGQFCAKRHETIYRRYGYTCKPGSDGRLRLHRR
jgi:hypothetical protein